MGELPCCRMEHAFKVGPEPRLATPSIALPHAQGPHTLTPRSLCMQVIVCANGANFTREGPVTNLTTGTFTDEEPSDADVQLPPRSLTTCK